VVALNGHGFALHGDKTATSCPIDGNWRIETRCAMGWQRRLVFEKCRSVRRAEKLCWSMPGRDDRLTTTLKA